MWRRLEDDGAVTVDVYQDGPELHQYNLRKRRADDALEVQSGISNHFKKLRLNNAPARIHTVERPRAVSVADEGDLMSIDETPSKVYIHDLAAEIAQIEADEPRDIFILDIDKKVSALPAKLLQSRPDPNTQLILYREPSSISVPEEEDAVRKAIIETRRRIRERQKEERKHEVVQGRINGNRRFWPDGTEHSKETRTTGDDLFHDFEAPVANQNMENDPDFMDID